MQQFFISAAIFVFLISVGLNVILIFSTIPFKNRTIKFLQGKAGDVYDAGFHAGWEKRKQLIEDKQADPPGHGDGGLVSQSDDTIKVTL